MQLWRELLELLDTFWLATHIYLFFKTHWLSAAVLPSLPGFNLIMKLKFLLYFVSKISWSTNVCGLFPSPCLPALCDIASHVLALKSQGRGCC